jgi:outer membrane protein assembly factor BamB
MHQHAASCFRAIHNTGVYTTTPAYRFLELSFTFRTEGPIRGTPALANGRLYFGSGDGNLYAVDAGSGTEHWRFQTGGPVQSSPAVTDNVVYFVSSDGNLYGVDGINGKEVWKFLLGRDLPYRNGFDYYLSSPTIVGRSLFVGGGDGNLYSFDLGSR